MQCSGCKRGGKTAEIKLQGGKKGKGNKDKRSSIEPRVMNPGYDEDHCESMAMGTEKRVSLKFKRCLETNIGKIEQLNGE